jgi:hypothetical protein
MTTATIPSTRNPLRLARSLAWLTVGLAALGFGIFEVMKHDLGWLPLAGFLVLPDLAMLVGAGQPHAKRQMPSRAVPLYNLLHRPEWGLALIVLASLGLLSVGWFVAGLGWLAHIGIDRGVGYRLRTADGWIRD